MSKICAICGKGRMSGKKVSHSNRKSNKVWNVNLQKIKVKDISGKVYVCANCIKSGNIQRA